MPEEVDAEKTQRDAQSVCDSVMDEVKRLGYPKEVALAVAMAASTRFIELTEG